MDILDTYYLETDENKRKQLLDALLEDYLRFFPSVLNNILNGKELRSSAYLFSYLSKKKRVTDYLNKYLTKKHVEILLNDSDPKVRKNTYIFLGNCMNKEYVMMLVNALKQEKTNFCIPSLILCLGNYKIKNIEEVFDEYNKILDERLNNNEIEKVHYDEIKEAMVKAVNKSKESELLTFTSLPTQVNFLLTCMNPLINATLSSVKKEFPDAVKTKDGILVKTDDMDKLYKIRTFYEALIVTKNNTDLSLDMVKESIKKFLSVGFFEKCHKELRPFSYRINLISTDNKEEKGRIINSIVQYLTPRCGDRYKNNPSSYDFEIRLIKKAETYELYYKICTYKDKRFDYREYDLPASINPVNAAVIMEETKEYFKDNHHVLDPFCGTCTMLIERSFYSNAVFTGVDINHEAIEYSFYNAKKANVEIKLFTDDCLNVTGKYDEIISNMPYGNRVSNHENNELLYKRFIHLLPSILTNNGVAILVTSEISLLKGLIKDNESLKLVRDTYLETGGLTPHLFVIKKV